MGNAEIIPFPADRSRNVLEVPITKKELAQRWHVSERWIEYRMKHDGLPYDKDPYSRLVRFSWSAVEDWRLARARLEENDKGPRRSGGLVSRRA